MPMYQYRCSECKEEVEVKQGFYETPLTVCPCGGELSRVFSSPAITLKGAGFYSTDSRTDLKKGGD